MPIYTYECRHCGKEFELLVGVNQEICKKECPYCKSVAIEKRFSLFGIRGVSNKGSGFNCSSCTSSNCSSCG